MLSMMKQWTSCRLRIYRNPIVVAEAAQSLWLMRFVSHSHHMSTLMQDGKLYLAELGDNVEVRPSPRPQPPVYILTTDHRKYLTLVVGQESGQCESHHGQEYQ